MPGELLADTARRPQALVGVGRAACGCRDHDVGLVAAHLAQQLLEVRRPWPTTSIPASASSRRAIPSRSSSESSPITTRRDHPLDQRPAAGRAVDLEPPAERREPVGESRAAPAAVRGRRRPRRRRATLDARAAAGLARRAPRRASRRRGGRRWPAPRRRGSSRWPRRRGQPRLAVVVQRRRSAARAARACAAPGPGRSSVSTAGWMPRASSRSSAVARCSSSRASARRSGGQLGVAAQLGLDRG